MPKNPITDFPDVKFKKLVDPEVTAKREEICKACAFFGQTVGKKGLGCRICDCSIKTLTTRPWSKCPHKPPKW
jgi:hypothetical protein